MFLRIHIILFALATGSVLLSIWWSYFTVCSVMDESDDEDEVIEVFKKRILQTHTTGFIGLLFICLPPATSAIVAGALNLHTYLILEQQQCCASFISSRSGYVDLYVNFTLTKLGSFVETNI